MTGAGNRQDEPESTWILKEKIVTMIGDRTEGHRRQLKELTMVKAGTI